MADDNMIDETSQPDENGQGNNNPDEVEDGDISDDDFDSLNLQLDELSSALDALEQKNDHIHAQLMKLLESNRETRQQFQESVVNEQKSDPQV